LGSAYAPGQPFIVTLATGSIADGLAFYLSDGNPISFEQPVVGLIGRGYLGPVPMPALVFVVVIVAAGVVLSRTVYGYTVYALGGNEEACRLSGRPIVRARTGTYTLAGARCPGWRESCRPGGLGSGIPPWGRASGWPSMPSRPS
jgi:ribose/xylose/arabinose/galactoside ABC-type transport system permease subunit